MNRAAHQPDHVLAHLEWVRALSVRLVTDAASADDLVQEAWLAASAQGTKGPGGGDQRRVRAWLGGVVRNLARSERRSGARRRIREVAATDTGRMAAAPDDLVARSEQLAAVAQHVLQLAEPFRRAMLLRWFEGLAPAAIAELEGVPASTIRSRLTRGRAELKALLDSEHGGHTSHWALALVPVAADAARLEPVTAAVHAKGIGLAAAALLVAGGTWQGIRLAGVDGPLGRAAPQLAELDAEGAGGADLLNIPGTSPPTERTGPTQAPLDLATTQQTAASAAAPQSADQGTTGAVPKDLGRLFGHVELPDGTPLPGANVYATGAAAAAGQDPARVKAISEDDGSFVFEGLMPGKYIMSSSYDGHLKVSQGSRLATGETPQTIVVEALLVHVSARASDGSQPRLTSIQESVVERDQSDEGGLLARRLRFEEPAESKTFLASAGTGYVYRAAGTDGQGYYGYLSPGTPAGTVDLVLTADAPAFGAVSIRLAHADLPDGAFLEIETLYSNGRHQSLFSPTKKASGGTAELILGGLLPGPYTVTVGLEDAGPVHVRRRSHDFAVVAGATHPIELDAYSGGFIEVQATSTTPFEERVFTDVSIRAAGKRTWQDLYLVSREAREDGGGVLRGNCARVDGPVARSFPIEPGDYEVRVTLDGYRTRTARIGVLRDETATLRAEMVPLR